MRTIEDIRRARLMQLLEMSEFPTIQSLADRIERSHAQVSQWKNRSARKGGGVSNIDSSSARHIEKKVGKPVGWMDNDPAYDPPLTAAPVPLTPPPPPAANFADPTQPTASEWQLLRDIKAYPKERRDALLGEVHAEAEKFRAWALEVLENASRDRR